jgi:hypothetical protein
MPLYFIFNNIKIPILDKNPSPYEIWSFMVIKYLDLNYYSKFNFDFNFDFKYDNQSLKVVHSKSDNKIMLIQILNGISFKELLSENSCKINALYNLLKRFYNKFRYEIIIYRSFVLSNLKLKLNDKYICRNWSKLDEMEKFEWLNFEQERFSLMMMRKVEDIINDNNDKDLMIKIKERRKMEDDYYYKIRLEREEKGLTCGEINKSLITL